MRLNLNPHIEWAPPPIVYAVAAQLLALALTAALARIASPGIVGLLLAQGLFASAIGHALRLPNWWLPIQFGFVPGLLLAAQLHLSPTWYFGGFVLLSLLFWNTFRTQVPLYLSRSRVWQALDKILPNTPGQRFIDLGSGVGGLVAYLARRRPDSEFVGIECAPLPSTVGAFRMLGLPNARSGRGDLWREDLSAYDVVFAYLSPVPMPALWEKAKREMRPGTRFISYRFLVPGAMPTETFVLDDWGRTRLYVWCM